MGKDDETYLSSYQLDRILIKLEGVQPVDSQGIQPF